MFRIASSTWLLLSLFLSACGFKPVYERSDNDGATTLPSIAIAVQGGTREAFTLRRALEEALPPSHGVPTYRLEAGYTTLRQPALIGRDGRVDRYNILINVNYRLYPQGSKQPVEASSAVAYTSYTVTESDFAAFAAERKATEDGLRRASQDIRLRVLARVLHSAAP